MPTEQIFHALAHVAQHIAALCHGGHSAVLPVLARTSLALVRVDQTITALRHLAELIRPGQGRHRRP
jgi:hypothetical protein